MTPRLSASAARRKGHNWERKIVRMFKARGYNAKRNLTETREGTSGDVLVYRGETLILAIEAKCTNNPNIWHALRQAHKAHTILGCPTCVFIKHTPRKGDWVFFNGKPAEYDTWRRQGIIELEYNQRTKHWATKMKLKDFMEQCYG